MTSLDHRSATFAFSAARIGTMFRTAYGSIVEFQQYLSPALPKTLVYLYGQYIGSSAVERSSQDKTSAMVVDSSSAMSMILLSVPIFVVLMII